MTLVLLAAAAAAAAQAAAAPLSSPPAAPAASAEPWPALQPLEAIRQPDWGDYHVYPPLARRLDQEGAVTAIALVGTNGVPRACRIAASSGHAELDAGTCALMMGMRFKPARDAGGAAVEASRGLKISWVLTDPTPLAFANLVVEIGLDGGRIVDCSIGGAAGVLPRQWRRIACQELTSAADAFFGAHVQGATRARVTLTIVPDHAVVSASPPLTVRELSPSPWRLAGERRTRFRVNGKGDPVSCRHLVDRGIGTPRENHAGPCGLFLNGSWFEAPKDPKHAAATFELRVYIAQPLEL